MPKLTAKTAILKVIDSKTFKDGALFIDIRKKCLEWGIPEIEIELAIQEMLDIYDIKETTIGYFQRSEINK